MVKTWTIYRHVSPSGKVYVGITSNSKPNNRWNSGRNYITCKYFYNAILKYGWGNFQHIIIASGLTEKIAKDLEKNLIKEYKELGISYNMTDGGDGTLGRIFSEETILKMKKAHKGKIFSNSHKEHMRAAQLKRTKYQISKVGIDNIRKGLLKYYETHNSPRKGVILSEEEKNKNRMSQKTRKSIIQYDLDMNIIAEFDSISYAAKVNNYTLSKIAECCKGKISKYKNYYWRYKDGN